VIALVATVDWMPLYPQTVPTIIPVHAIVSFTPSKPSKGWTVPVKGTDGQIIYVLSYERESSVAGPLAGIDLILRRAGDERGTRNLLAPSKFWHGYQKFIFGASDYAHGSQKSIYGKDRSIMVRGTNLRVRISVVNVKVSPDRQQFDDLDLDIHIENVVS